MNILKTAFNKVKGAYCTAPMTCNTTGMIIATGAAVGFLPHLAFPAVMLLAIGALSDVALNSTLNPPKLGPLSDKDILSLIEDKETQKQDHGRMVKMGILKS